MGGNGKGNGPSILERLGFDRDERLVIIHADDIGMSQATVGAYTDLVDFGLVSSAAVLVPCPWFPAVAAFCRAHPGVDMGVHLDLTCEYDDYRWGPISTRQPSSGLLDEDGYFHRRSETAQERVQPGAASTELQSQVRRALGAGIDVTHVDTHMGTALHPKLMTSYFEVALRYQVPATFARLDEAGWMEQGFAAAVAAAARKANRPVEELGMPVLDHLAFLPLDRPENRLEQAKAALGELKPGITHFIIHPAKDTPELRAITSTWPARVADYETFTSVEMKRFVEECGVRVIGYRALRDLMRAS